MKCAAESSTGKVAGRAWKKEGMSETRMNLSRFTMSASRCCRCSVSVLSFCSGLASPEAPMICTDVQPSFIKGSKDTKKGSPHQKDFRIQSSTVSSVSRSHPVHLLALSTCRVFTPSTSISPPVFPISCLLSTRHDHGRTVHTQSV